jgi:hypothetical protein
MGLTDDEDDRQLDVFAEAAAAVLTAEAMISQGDELFADDEQEATAVDDMTGMLVDAVVVVVEEEAVDVDAILLAGGLLLLTTPEFSFCSSVSDSMLLVAEAASGTT